MKKKKIFLAFLIITSINVVFLGVDKTYSRYVKDININVNTTSAEMICDVTIDNPGTYISNDGWAYFKLIVKNYNASNVITKVPIQYNLTVANQAGSSAVYRYLDADGYSSDFDTTLTTRNYTFTSGTQQSQIINVEVKTDSMSSENVDFIVDLNCYQTQN